MMRVRMAVVEPDLLHHLQAAVHVFVGIRVVVVDVDFHLAGGATSANLPMREAWRVSTRMRRLISSSGTCLIRVKSTK